METTRIGTLQAGEERAIQMRGTARSMEPIAMCVAVDYTPAMCSMIEVVQAEIEVAMTLQPEREAYICEEFLAVVGVRNTGRAESEPVTLTVDLPEGVRTSDGDQQVELDMGPIPPGETLVRQIALDPQSGGQYELRAVARAGEREVATTPQQVRFIQPELELTVDGPRSQYLGRPIDYQVQLRNTSEFPARDVELMLQIPEQAQRVSASVGGFDPETGVVRMDRLEAGESRTIRVQFDANQAGEMQLGATARAYCVDEVQGRAQTTVEGISAIQISVVDRQDPVQIDGETTYEIRVLNEGSAEDLDIRLEADMPESLEFVRGQGDTEVQSENGSLRFAPLERLAPGDVAGWNITVRATQPGSVRFEVRMRSEANQEPVTTMEPTTLVR